MSSGRSIVAVDAGAEACRGSNIDACEAAAGALKALRTLEAPVEATRMVGRVGIVDRFHEGIRRQ